MVSPVEEDRQIYVKTNKITSLWILITNLAKYSIQYKSLTARIFVQVIGMLGIPLVSDRK